MRRSISLLLVGFAGACTAPTLENSTRATPGRLASLALVGVDIVDVEAGRLMPRQTVIVSGDRIEAVGETGRVAVPAGAKRIDARGKTLIPGLWDMHVHLSKAGDCTLPILVTYGVTGVRDMGGDPDQLKAWRRAVSEGRLTGPYMQISSPAVESRRWLNWVAEINKKPWQEVIGKRTPVGSPDEAVEQVSNLTASGVDLIKIRNLDNESYRALLAEAQRQGIPVAGHLTGGKATLEAVFDPATADNIGTAGKGFVSIEHIEGFTMMMGPLDEAKRQAVFEAMRRHGTMLAPSLVTHAARLASRSELRRLIDDDGTINPDVSPQLRQGWLEQYELVQPDSKFDWKAHVAKVEEDAKRAQRAGVRMLVGTDLGVQSLIPGRSVHEEMAEMVRLLSMTPAEALRTATINAASAAGLGESAGRIARGYRADLVLLDANPLADIGRTRSISGIVNGGRWLDRSSVEVLRSTTRRTMRQGGVCLAA
ncbi:MAG TPA: amidohydrolase family protein [Allosphingosinicella sp.]